MSDPEPHEAKIAYYCPNDDVPKLIRINKPPDQVTLGDFIKAINLRSGCHKFFFKNHVDEVGIVKEQITELDAKLPSFKGHVTCYIEFDHLINNHDHGYHPGSASSNHHHHHHPFHSKCTYDSCSDMDGTCCGDSDDDDSLSRITTTTDETSVSRVNTVRQRRRRHQMPPLSRTSSVTSFSDSTVSATCVTVELDLDESNFLGMSLVGHSNGRGIYVGAIMTGGAVAKDGRIQPGDMILQVNDIIFDGMSNDDAVQVIRGVVQKPGRIKLVVAKGWDPDPKSYFSIPRNEPVQPLDLEAWVNHTEAARGLSQPDYLLRPPSVSTLTSTSSSLPSSFAESEQRQLLMETTQLSTDMDMMIIAKCMAKEDSGLEIKEREWLKVKIPDAFLGSDVVNWLYSHVQGFKTKRDAEKYAAQMLKTGFIKHTVNKNSFSNQRYYIFDHSVRDLGFEGEIL